MMAKKTPGEPMPPIPEPDKLPVKPVTDPVPDNPNPLPIRQPPAPNVPPINDPEPLTPNWQGSPR
jgi:hypothetical protein